MRMHVCGALAISAALAAVAVAQNPPASPGRPKYLDVMTVQVKSDKHADFDRLVRKAADANRRFKGDHWIAWGAAFGAGNTIHFTTPRTSFDDVEKGMAAFHRALKEGLGPATGEHDFAACIERSRTEIRAMRWDLSRNVPDEIQGIQERVGNARWVVMTDIDVKRSKAADWQAAATEFQDALAKSTPQVMMLVSQTIMGGNSDSVQFHIASYLKNLAEMDAMGPISQRLGEELYRKFVEVNGEAVARVSQSLLRPIPDWSNPAEALINVSRDFWTPKPPMTAARKAKPEKAQR